jgi:hypothetical protein
MNLPFIGRNDRSSAVPGEFDSYGAVKIGSVDADFFCSKLVKCIR